MPKTLAERQRDYRSRQKEKLQLFDQMCRPDYEHGFYAWIQFQSSLLRAGRLKDLDIQKFSYTLRQP